MFQCLQRCFFHFPWNSLIFQWFHKFFFHGFHRFFNDIHRFVFQYPMVFIDVSMMLIVVFSKIPCCSSIFEWWGCGFKAQRLPPQCGPCCFMSTLFILKSQRPRAKARRAASLHAISFQFHISFKFYLLFSLCSFSFYSHDSHVISFSFYSFTSFCVFSSLKCLYNFSFDFHLIVVSCSLSVQFHSSFTRIFSHRVWDISNERRPNHTQSLRWWTWNTSSWLKSCRLETIIIRIPILACAWYKLQHPYKTSPNISKCFAVKPHVPSFSDSLQPPSVEDDCDLPSCQVTHYRLQMSSVKELVSAPALAFWSR